MSCKRQARTLFLAVAVLGGLTISAAEGMAFAEDVVPAAARSGLDFPALTFVQGAPPPLVLMALGALVMGVTFSRRLRKVRASD